MAHPPAKTIWELGSQLKFDEPPACSIICFRDALEHKLMGDGIDQCWGSLLLTPTYRATARLFMVSGRPGGA